MRFLFAARRARPAVVWRVAATMGAAVGGGIVYVTMHRTPAPEAPAPQPSPSRTPAPPVPQKTDLVAAVDLRRDAIAECDAKKWDERLSAPVVPAWLSYSFTGVCE